MKLERYGWSAALACLALSTAHAEGTNRHSVMVGVQADGRAGEAGFEQNDWAAALNWHGSRGGVGADLFLRSAKEESQTVDSRGYGLHGDLALTPRFSVLAGAMRYEHDFSVTSTAPQTSTLLSSLFGSTAAATGVWRDQAFIDRSYRIGGIYHLQGAAVGAQYFSDRVANSDDSLSTVQLQAEFLIAQRWLVSPTIGYSYGSATEHAAYGGVSLGLAW
jgi:hypothetical protein